MSGGEWIDLSVEVHAGMPVWEGAEAPRIEPLCEIGPDCPCRVTRVVLDAHLGSHLDAPGHYIEGGGMVESLDLADLIGPCTIVDAGEEPVVTSTVLERLDVPVGCRRLLVRTSNTRQRLMERPDFVRDYVGLDVGGARWIVERGIRLVGFDYLSVQAWAQPDEVHRLLLGRGVVLVEGLDLSKVVTGPHELICLPPKWRGSDGAPVRAVVRPL